MFDTIIIGGGCAGLSAGMYAARLNLKTVLLAELAGGLITTTHVVENWPGIITTTGPDLGNSLWEHAKASGVEMKNELARNVVKLPDGSFEVQARRNSYQAKTVIFATGSSHKHLGCAGEEEFKNKGVSYCALCDGAFFKGKDVVVVGGGDTAAKEALFLSEHAKTVKIIVRRDVLRAEPRNNGLISQKQNIEILFQEEITSITGGTSVEKITLKSGKELAVQGVFVAIGQIPATDLAVPLGVALNPKKEIVINRHSETNVPGVYGAGDCCDTEFKQAITGAAEGVTAAYYAFLYTAGK
ncbi:MAG: FAD-dependent oxidoreductase [Patescibacteria group bacterium]